MTTYKVIQDTSKFRGSSKIGPIFIKAKDINEAKQILTDQYNKNPFYFEFLEPKLNFHLNECKRGQQWKGETEVFGGTIYLNNSPIKVLPMLYSSYSEVQSRYEGYLTEVSVTPNPRQEGRVFINDKQGERLEFVEIY